MQDVSNTPKLLLLSAAIAAISACSDGGSSSGADPVNDTPVESVTQSLSGNAVKGVMASAVVTATSLDGSQSYGSTQTAADGTYALSELTLGNGPVLLELTTDSDTQLTCDSAIGCTFNGTTHAFGAKFTFNDPDFSLTSVLPGMSDTATEARLMITPVTHMAAQRVAASGATTAEEIEGVNRATARLLGLDNVDINSLVPSDITNSQASEDNEAAQRYGALVAAFATLAETSGGDISDVIDAISNDFAQDGSMKANSSVGTELALANIFNAAKASAEKAEEAGVSLGTTGVTLALEALEAETAPVDSVVTPDTAEEIPTELLTEEEAVDAGVALLEDLNNWYQALNNSDVEAKGDMYAEQLEAAADLMPAFNAASSELKQWQDLVTSSETRCISEGLSYNSETDTYTPACYEYGEVATPGPLMQTLPIAGWLGQFTQYIEQNHDVLESSSNEDGSYSLSTTDLGDDIYDLDIVEFLSDDEGALVEGTEVVATYTLNAGKIATIRFYGTGEELNLASEATPAALAHAQLGSTLIYGLSDLVLTPVSAEDAEFTSISIPSASVILAFATESDASAFIPAIDNGDVVNPATVVAISASFSGSAESEQGTATFTVDAEYDSPTEATRSLDVEISILGDTDKDGTNEIDGTVSLALSGDYTQEGDMTDGYSVTIQNVSGEAEFEGSIEASLEDGSSATFNGSLAVNAVGLSDNSEVQQDITAIAEGSVQIIDNRAGNAATVTFDGIARLKEKALLTPAGDVLILEGHTITRPYEMYVSGELSTTENGNTASIAVSGLARVSNQDSFRVSPPSLPEDGSSIVINFPMQLDGPDKVVFDTSTFETQLTDALNITTENAVWINLYLPMSVTRVLHVNDPETSDDDQYELVLEYEDYTNSLLIDVFNTYYASTPVDPTDDLRDIVTAVIYSEYTSTAFSADFEGENSDIYAWGSNWSEGVSITENYVVQINGHAYSDIDVNGLISSSETEDMYRNISLALNIDASATGLDDASIRITAVRTGLEDLTGNVTLSYNSTDLSTQRVISLQLDTAMDATNGEFNYLTVADADTEMKIQATCVSDDETDECGEFEFTGIITVADTQIGELESRDGVPVFRFGNGERYRILTPNFLVEKVAD